MACVPILVVCVQVPSNDDACTPENGSMTCALLAPALIVLELTSVGRRTLPLCSDPHPTASTAVMTNKRVFGKGCIIADYKLVVTRTIVSGQSSKSRWNLRGTFLPMNWVQEYGQGRRRDSNQ